MTCKNFKPDHSTELDGWGQCQKIIDFKAKGATPAMCISVIHEKLNGGQFCAGNYIFERACCDETKGCEKFEESDN